ncbi:ATP-binding protein [Mariniluteicoccus flavus]
MQPPQHRLSRIQLANWGTFHGYHDLPVPARGLLITGDSGTGKSTLLDAMATLLVPPRWSAFNAAANQGGSGDRSRTLATYVRGAHGRGMDEATGQVTVNHLRATEATWSGVALTYTHTDGRVTTLVQLFHLARHKNQATDVSRLLLLCEESVDLDQLRAYAENGLAPRRVSAAHPDWHHTATYSVFSSRMQRRLGLGGEQALRLLHKTQSAKNLDNLNQLLRDFMLDEPATFKQAADAVDQFVELSQAHASVIDARDQVACLLPLRDHVATHAAALEALDRLDRQALHLDTHVLQVRTRLLVRDLETRRARARAAAQETAQANNKASLAQEFRDTCATTVAGIAGDLPALEQVVHARAAAVDAVTRERDRVGRTASRARLTLPDSASSFAQWQDELITLRSGIDVAEANRELGLVVSRRNDLATRERELQRELRVLGQQQSNLGSSLLDVRSHLCRALGVDTGRLRFAGELIDVAEEYAGWQGAIERVLRPLAQTLLVPDDLYRGLAAEVDATWLKTRLVYARLIEPRGDDRGRPERSDASLLNRISVAEGEQHAWLWHRLCEAYDYDCVDTVDAFAYSTKAVTAAGQVKHATNRYEKDDRHRIDDRTRWILGSTTTAKREALEAALADTQADLTAADAELARAQNARDHQRDLAGIIDELLEVSWPSVDLTSAEAALDQARAVVADRRRASTELSHATAELERAVALLASAQAATRRCHTEQTNAEQRVAEGEKQLAGWRDDLGHREPVPDAVAETLAADWGLTESASEFDDAVARAGRGIGERRLAEQNRRSGAENRAGRVMQAYRFGWAERSADLAPEMAYADEFLARLRELEEDGLPAFEERFFDMLQSQSRNNVGQLARQLRTARREIRTRIDPINESLLRSQFAPGRFLQVKVVDRILPAVADFLAELTAITTDSLEDVQSLPDEAEGRRAAEVRFDRMKALLDRLASQESADVVWRRQVLDTRQHVEFVARVVDADGVETDVFTDSGGLSGGERQKLVTFCLVAALRYQLARNGAPWPEYALVVLDEAFDKTDPSFTRAGLEVFREFGFQLLLATPMKMLQTLEDHVGGAAVVSMDADHHSRLSVLTFDDGDGEELPPPPPSSAQDALL